MKSFIQLKLFILLLFTAQLVFATTPLDAEFMKFFNTKYAVAVYETENVAVTHKSGMVADLEMRINIKLNLKSVEKVLVLKIPESGYDDVGGFNKDCTRNPIFIGGYTLNPSANVTELNLSMRSLCGQAPNRLLVWVRTSDGKYYLGKLTFKATSSANTVDS